MHLYFFTGENFCERNLPGSEILVKKFFEHDELEKTSSRVEVGKEEEKDEKRGLADFAAPFVQSGKRMKGSKGMCHCSSIESKIEKQALCIDTRSTRGGGIGHTDFGSNLAHKFGFWAIHKLT